MVKILNLKLEILEECQKIKNIFAKSYSPDSFEEVFVIKKSETLGRGHVLLVIIKVKKLLENFTKKNYKIKSRRI